MGQHVVIQLAPIDRDEFLIERPAPRQVLSQERHQTIKIILLEKFTG